MRRLLGCYVVLIFSLWLGLVSRPHAEDAERRIALVLGNAAYQVAPLSTSTNDAGLIAQTLQAAGFDVVGARDLDQEALRRAFRDFQEKAANSGPNTVAFVYLSGYGLQLEGENYFVPVDARITSAADVAAQAIRLSDYTRALVALNLKASIFVFDAARKNPFSISGEPLAGGLALVEPGPRALVAFNAAPGTVAPEQSGPYGSYAQALAEMMREGGLSLNDVFERTRLRVSELTRGAEVPWNAARMETSFVFFERSPDAPVPVAEEDGERARVRSRPLAELGAGNAYMAVLERDTLEGYEDFLAAYPDDPMARRVRAIVAARREAITWRETCLAETAEAYWSYLRRYPHGLHSADARRRLALRAVALAPPPSFTEIDYDVPPPSPEENIYIERPVLAFDDPDFGFAPPPPVPLYFLPLPELEFIALGAPLVPAADFVLPIPVFVPIPVWCHVPRYVAPPPENVIFNNVHNTVIIDHERHVATIKDRDGHFVAEPGGAHDVAHVHAALAPALPHSLAMRVAHAPSHDVIPTASAPRPRYQPLGQPLPGSQGHALPALPLPRRPVVGGPPTPTPVTRPLVGGPPKPVARIAPSPPTVIRTAPPPVARVAPAPPPVMRTTPPPLARIAPPPVMRAAPPPVVRAAPPPVMRAAPPPVARVAPPPVMRAAPPPMVRAAPPPVARVAPPPVVRAAPPPMVRAAPPPVMRAAPPPVMHAAPPTAARPGAPGKRT